MYNGTPKLVRGAIHTMRLTWLSHLSQKQEKYMNLQDLLLSGTGIADIHWGKHKTPSHMMPKDAKKIHMQNRIIHKYIAKGMSKDNVVQLSNITWKEVWICWILASLGSCLRLPCWYLYNHTNANAILLLYNSSIKKESDGVSEILTQYWQRFCLVFALLEVIDPKETTLTL